ncbi:MAG: FAD-binding protein, partial [Flavisolibacter sp.]
MFQIQENISLKPHNTFGIDATAQSFTCFSSVEELIEILMSPVIKHQPFLILGGGSNILLTKDFDGVVLKNEIKGIEINKEDADHFYLKVGAGENWHSFVMFCVENNYAG